MEATSFYDVPELYDLLCPPLGADAPEVRFFAELVAGDAAILELAGGTGRVALALAESGRDVTVLDLSAPMLARGRAHAAARGVDVTWVAGDMRGARLGRRFDLVFITFNSLLYMHARADLEAVFETVRAHLTPDGVFALSVFNPDVRTYARAPARRVRLAPRPLVDDAGRRWVVEETMAYDAATQTSGARLHFSTDEQRDAVVVDVDLRALYPQELDALLHYNGYRVLKRFGDFTGASFTSASPQQVIVAQPVD